MSTYTGKLFLEKVCVNIAILCSEEHMRKEMESIIDSYMKRFYQSIYKIIIVEDISELLRKGDGFDIVFWDADMALQEEEEKAKVVYVSNPGIKIIFLAKDDCYINSAFRVRAYRYLLKHHLQKDIEETLADAVKDMEDACGIGYEINGESKWLFAKDILYVESIGDMAILYLEDTYVTVKKTLNYLRQVLGRSFYQCHKSFIVNFYFIEAVRANGIILKNGAELPISVRRKNEFINTYHLYIRNLAIYKRDYR